MNCAEARDLVHPYLDQELDLVRVVDIDKHLQSCAACRALYDQQRALHSTVRRDASYYHAPEEMRERLRFTLRGQAAEPTRPPAYWHRWWNTAAAIAAAVMLSVSAALYVALPTPQDRLADDVVSSHVRSLMANHLSDVASSDQHTVKPWFIGKLDYSPPVIDLAAQGFPLVGGRLDYLDGRPVAALIYHRRQHVINLFVWPREGGREQKPHALSQQGYNLLHWVEGGMEFWAVSDLNEAELKEFVNSLRNR